MRTQPETTWPIGVPHAGGSSGERSFVQLASVAFRRARFVLLVSVGVLLLALVLFVLMRFLSHNRGVVVKGELYRSAQLDAKALRREILKDHLRSVVNLRGVNTNSRWYQQEITLCQQMGVVHADVRLGARHLPSPGDIAQLLDIYHNLPRPMLVHCGSGSDRSGLASSVYLIDQKNLSPDEAERQLSLNFGHLAIYPYFEMNEFIELYGQDNPHHRPFRQWVVQDYPGIYERESEQSKWSEMLEPLKSWLRIFSWQRN